MNFNLIQTDPSSSARAGSFRTDHGTIETPIFMPVGTAASVKGVHLRELKDDIKPDIILDLTDVKRTNLIKKGESYLWKDFDPLPLIQKHTDNLRASVLFVIKEFPNANIR